MAITHLKDIPVGTRIGRFVVLGVVPPEKRRGYRLRCACECGVEVIRPLYKIRKMRSCRNCYMSPHGAAGYVFRHYVYRARERGLVLDITIEQFLIIAKRNCYYCGGEPKMIFNSGKARKVSETYTYNGMDRVDNDQGYTLDNVRTCCKFCNFFKGALSEQDFLNLVAHAAKIAQCLNIEPQENEQAGTHAFRHRFPLAR